ncbi:hypothetical protein Dfulv_18470 [Dactylosporangium fulvum]|uniref:Uncharacterized protein n=1 Tax=Dactylosporangium fulvum TaxID=53359 RepID=A0ABY5W9T8_9ACTN|nr:hypothetical protein [Dactylosporangium fulvum]UWP86115.1 hypothetical protein Dfulv_18470 [Dactylosporangium fulvum]
MSARGGRWAAVALLLAQALLAQALLAQALLAQALLTACHDAPAPSVPPSASPSVLPSVPVSPAVPPGPGTPGDAGMRTVLEDSFVRDGARGYFVDAAARSPAFSLYTSAWNLRLAEATGAGTDGLAPGSVAAWIGPALDGRAPEGLPPVAQLDLAVGMLQQLGAPIDRDRVARTLAELYRADRYAASGTVPDGDWGSTALAVGVAVRLGVPVPSQVVAATAAALADRGLPLGATVAALITAAALHDRLDAGAAALAAARVRETAAVLAAQPPDMSVPAGGPDAADLSLAYQLGAAARRLGAGDLRPPVRCFTRPDDAPADPQVRFYAHELGCAAAGEVVPTAHSRAGWPTVQAARAAVAASAAGARLAATSGVLDRYAPALRRQLAEVWLPRPGPDPTEPANLAVLADVLGAAGPGDVTDAQLRAAASDDVRLLLCLLRRRLARAGPPGRAAVADAVAAARTRAAPPSLWRAAWLAVAGELLADPALGEAARREAAALRLADGIYAAAPGRPPTIGASSVGVWLVPPDGDTLAAWSRAGLCGTGGCAALVATPASVAAASTAPDATGPAGLRDLAAVAACARQRCRDAFPIAF